MLHGVQYCGGGVEKVTEFSSMMGEQVSILSLVISQHLAQILPVQHPVAQGSIHLWHGPSYDPIVVYTNFLPSLLGGDGWAWLYATTNKFTVTIVILQVHHVVVTAVVVTVVGQFIILLECPNQHRFLIRSVLFISSFLEV